MEKIVEKLKEKKLFLTDSHSHAHFEPLCSNFKNVLENMNNYGVGRIINIGINLEDAKKSVELAKKYDFIYAAVGVHPHDSAEFRIEQLGFFEEMLMEEKVIAVGEIGLDYFRDYAPRETQKSVFRIFLDLAKSLNKPIIIHNRDATDDLIDILNEMNTDKKLKGILHCFNGDKKILKWALDNDFYISFAGNVTYKKAIEIRDAAKDVPLERVLVETDCPYLAPVPKRGKTNEPAYVYYTAKFMADFYSVDFVEFVDRVEKNLKNLFGELNASSNFVS